jgi:putative endonuclease
MRIWYVYMLRCADNSLYTGISTDVAARLVRHNAGTGAAYTRSHRPVTLVWHKRMSSESAARKREAHIKTWTKRDKELFLERMKRLPNGPKTRTVPPYGHQRKARKFVP